MAPDGHQLLLPFDTDDAEFARGFEIGRLWAMLTLGDREVVAELAHTSNAEMLIRLGEATGRRAVAEIHDDTWLIATFTEDEYVESAL